MMKFSFALFRGPEERTETVFVYGASATFANAGNTGFRVQVRDGYLVVEPLHHNAVSKEILRVPFPSPTPKKRFLG